MCEDKRCLYLVSHQMLSPVPYLAYDFSWKSKERTKILITSMEHDTIIWNLPPLFFIYWMPCNVNCTRIIPFRENLAQSHRFKSFWLWAVTHILISCIHHELCTHSLRGKWKMHLRKRTISSFFHCSNLSHCQTSATTSHKCRNCSMNLTSSRTFSFTSEQVLPEPLSVLVSSMYVCVCGWRRRRRCQMRQWYLHSNTISIVWSVWCRHCLFKFHLLSCKLQRLCLCLCSENYLA